MLLVLNVVFWVGTFLPAAQADDLKHLSPIQLSRITQPWNPTNVLESDKVGVSKHILVFDPSRQVDEQAASVGLNFVTYAGSYTLADYFRVGIGANNADRAHQILRVRVKWLFFALCNFTPCPISNVEGMCRPEVADLHLNFTKAIVHLDLVEWSEDERKTGTLLLLHKLNLSKRSIRRPLSALSSFPGFYRLPADDSNGGKCSQNQPPIGPFEGCVPLWRVGTGFGLICLAGGLFVWAVRRNNGWLALFCGFLFLVGSLIWLARHYWCGCQKQTEYRQTFQHDGGNVSQIYLEVTREPVRQLPTYRLVGNAEVSSVAESRLKGWLEWAHHLYWISEALTSIGAGALITKWIVTYFHLDFEWKLTIWLLSSGILLFVFALLTSSLRRRSQPQASMNNASTALIAAVGAQGPFDVEAFFRTSYFSPLQAEAEKNIRISAIAHQPNDVEGFYLKLIGIGIIAIVYDTIWWNIF
jgi:hypothetical protein